MWYQVPATKPEPAKVTQLFPWERHAPKPTRVFLEDQPSTISTTSVESPSTSSREEYRPSTASWTSWTADEPSAVSWDSYSRSNAWDEVPEIQKYIRSIQQARKGNIQVLSGGPSPGNKPPGGQTPEHGMRGMRVTDYPTEIERPSLPVTPALIRRYSGPASGGDTTDEQLPIAEGVPNQDDWVGLTVDVFLHLLRATYLYCKFTESVGTPRRALPAPVRGFGESRFSAA